MRVTATLALLVLLLASLAASVPATAQPPAVPEGEPLYQIDDAEGDVTVAPFGLNAGGPGIPAPPVTDPYDLTAFRILADDPDRLAFDFTVKDWQAVGNPNTQGPFVGIFSNPQFSLTFALAGTDIMYEIDASGYSYSCSNFVSCEYRFFVDLCIRTPETGCYYQPVRAWFLGNEDRFAFDVSKRALLGLEENQGFGSSERPDRLPRHMPAGTAFDSFFVSFGNLYFRDEAPDQGQAAPYRTQTPSANTRVVVDLENQEEESFNPFFGPPQDEDTTPRVGVSPGVPSVVPLEVTNNADTKRLVNLTVEFPDAPGAKWSAQIAPAVQVPAGETRVVNLILNATQAVAHRENTTVFVHARAVGHDDEIGFLRVLAEGSVPPTPTSNVLHFHAAGTNYDAAEWFLYGQQPEQWVNTLDEDPRANLDAEGYATTFSFPGFGIQWGASFEMDTPLVRDVLFDPEEPVTASAYFSAQVPYEGNAELNLYAGDQYLGGANVPGTVGSDPTEFAFTFFIDPEAARVAPDDGRLRISLLLGGGLESANTADMVKFHAADSRVVLPVIPDPDADEQEVHLGPARLGLSLAADTDQEEFVNPNRTKLFQLILVNEGVETDSAHLNVTYPEDTGWGVRVEPADEFDDLAPGESVTVGVLVRAPSNASEGDQFDVSIEAVSGKDADATSRIMITTIATQGVDIPDEADTYEADKDTLSKAQQEEGGDSPGIGLFAAALAATAGLLMARRRKEKR